ncbi:hypothetical protein GCK72_022508 [Caenorhabditis remanei]|uniref:Arrestin-like N-terminal domain-containing protein n=1 Tax=Caenorhabditis remanei TaxID=31234 RepID=A0A6A5FTZ9_CAERE|nr:hypothetical protein GCK72_022508 [Caenorhabditis remanei]KAF1746057.1 hypothetical protein GCK72_022508 [Caenorhabditis remanei]
MQLALTTDNIQFDENQERFKLMEIVRGTVSFNAPKDFHVTAIIARCKGEARTRWDGVPRAGYWRYFDKEVYMFHRRMKFRHVTVYQRYTLNTFFDGLNVSKDVPWHSIGF